MHGQQVSSFRRRCYLCKGVYEGEQGGHKSPSAKSLRGRQKVANNVTNTFFNTVNLLPKDLRFEHGDAKHDPCPGRHLTSLRPCACALFIVMQQ